MSNAPFPMRATLINAHMRKCTYARACPSVFRIGFASCSGAKPNTCAVCQSECTVFGVCACERVRINKTPMSETRTGVSLRLCALPSAQHRVVCCVYLRFYALVRARTIGGPDSRARLRTIFMIKPRVRLRAHMFRSFVRFREHWQHGACVPGYSIQVNTRVLYCTIEFLNHFNEIG